MMSLFTYLVVSCSAGQGVLGLLHVAGRAWVSYMAAVAAAAFHKSRSGNCKISYDQKLYNVTSNTFYYLKQVEGGRLLLCVHIIYIHSRFQIT